jgi:glycosyltransferase involved in cell wall biosynthesis
MLRLMDKTPEQRREMGELGREHVRVHYGLSRVVERWQDLYRQVSVRKGLNLAPTLLR